jgi:anti-sigma B factor antagonist
MAERAVFPGDPRVSLDIQQRESEGILILDLNGRITVGDAASILRETLRGLAGGGSRNFILNLQEVDYIDSTGLGAMVVCFTSLRKLDGKLKLENLNRRNVELLVLTKLTTVFEIFNDEQDAVNSFFPDREIKRFDILSFVKEQTDA